MKLKKFQTGDLIKFIDNNRLYYVKEEPCNENMYTVNLHSVDGERKIKILHNSNSIQKVFRVKK